MHYKILADSVVLLHFAFVLFALFGALLIFKWRLVIWLHIPAMIWAALIEFAGWICPLTYLENYLRVLGEQAGYHGGFVEHYIMAILYPEGLTREIQYILGAIVLGWNALIYWMLFRRRKRVKQ